MDLDKEEPKDHASSGIPPGCASTALDARAPRFKILQGHSLIIANLIPAILLVISLFVASGLVLILLPQSSVDSLARRLQAHHGRTEPEKIAFLYLGDELRDHQLQIRGVIRNITTNPIEQLDAVIRLYAYDGSLLETAVVRLSKEVIGSGEIAQFVLVYPDYRQQFNSYSVEFKLRDGSTLPYKDMRVRSAAPS